MHLADILFVSDGLYKYLDPDATGDTKDDGSPKTIGVTSTPSKVPTHKELLLFDMEFSRALTSIFFRTLIMSIDVGSLKYARLSLSNIASPTFRKLY
jgi:hypothetical protein